VSVFVEWTRTVQDHFVRLQKLLGRGRELLINWEAPMASTFISSFSAQGAELYQCSLTRPQLHCVVAALLEPNSRLRELNIGGNYGTADPMLPFTHPDNLAKAVKKLEVVHLEGVNLTVEQLEEVMEEVLDRNSNTEVLDLSYNGELEKVGKELKEKVLRSEVEAYLHINPPPPAPVDAPAPPPAVAPAEAPVANPGPPQNLDFPQLEPVPLGLELPGPFVPAGPPGPPGPPLVFQPPNALDALDELGAFPWEVPMDIN